MPRAYAENDRWDENLDIDGFTTRETIVLSTDRVEYGR